VEVYSSLNKIYGSARVEDTCNSNGGQRAVSTLMKKKHVLWRSCGADLSLLSDNHVGKRLAGSRHMKIQPCSGLSMLNAFFHQLRALASVRTVA